MKWSTDGRRVLRPNLSWRCHDCGVSTRRINEYYMVHDEVWADAAGDVDGLLCIGCLDTRLVRVRGNGLEGNDFSDVPVNLRPWRRSARLAALLSDKIQG